MQTTVTHETYSEKKKRLIYWASENRMNSRVQNEWTIPVIYNTYNSSSQLALVSCSIITQTRGSDSIGKGRRMHLRS